MPRKTRRTPSAPGSQGPSAADQDALVRAAFEAGQSLSRALAPMRSRQGPATAADLRDAGAALVAAIRTFSARVRARLDPPGPDDRR